MYCDAELIFPDGELMFPDAEHEFRVAVQNLALDLETFTLRHMSFSP